MNRAAYAALAAALLLLSGCRREAASTSQPAPAPEPPTTIAWWGQGTLHVGGDSIETRKPDTIRYVAGTTLVRHHERWAIVVDGRLDRLPLGIYNVVISPDGRFVAWVVEHTVRQVAELHFVDAARVVRRDTETGDVDRSASWRAHVECCDAVGSPSLARVSNAGLVTGYANFRGRAWTWRPHRERTPLRGVTGRQLSTHVRSVDGRHVAIGRLPLEGDDWRVLGWESPTTVVLVRATMSGDAQVHEIARCEKRSHSCTPVPGEPHGHTVLPDRYS
ncbi:hypothetical protein [Nocardioides mangrovi]|uniref:Lipoprotein n=1 Tax=Nocardioides mangrovi TaxID=2874580 RepID=A0ABS7UEB0_9ACTN|nr:hypothetical protein [Nocardioides mangrovi]MBZ5739336.1 hypothetical protein [Nocardioides mangrovi]